MFRFSYLLFWNSFYLGGKGLQKHPYSCVPVSSYSTDYRDLLDEAKDYHLMPERRPLLQTFKARPRCCTDIPGLVYAVGGLTSSGKEFRKFLLCGQKVKYSYCLI